MKYTIKIIAFGLRKFHVGKLTYTDCGWTRDRSREQQKVIWEK